MKKKILGLLLCFCLVLPCMMFLSACDKEDININIYTYTEGFNSGVQEIRLIDSSSFSSSSWENYRSIGNDKVGKEITKFTAKEDSEIQIFIVLKPGYDINDVKVKPNGANSTELSPSNSYKDGESESWVYAYTVAEKLKEELWIMFSGKPALRTQTITLAQSNTDYFDQAEEHSGDPASVFLADAKFTLFSKLDNGIIQEIFTDLTLEDFKSKLESNYSFEIPASSTLSLRITTGEAAYTVGGLPQVLNLSSVGLFEYDETKQTFTDTSSTLSTQVFADKTMTINWKEIASNELLAGVSVHVTASFRSNIYVKDITRLDGSSLWANDTPFNFSEHNQVKDDGYYVKFDITSTDYIILTDPTTTITFGNGVQYTSTEAIEAGVLAFDNTEAPTEAWFNPKGVDITDGRTLWIHIMYNAENIAQNTNFQALQLKTSTENNNTSPYKFARFDLAYTDTDPDFTFIESSGRPEGHHDDWTHSINYSCYYLKGSELTINHLEVGYTGEKTNISDMREQSIGQTITINFKTTNGIQTLTATFVEYEENYYHWQFETLPTWLTNEGGDYYDQYFPFTIDTEVLKTATGGDLYEIEIVVPDHVA